MRRGVSVSYAAWPIALVVALAACRGREDAAIQVRGAVEEFGAAFARTDTATLRRLLTEDYVHVNGASGRLLDRESWLRWMGKRRAKRDAGRLVMAFYRVTDVEVRMHGNAAIATGIVHAAGMEDHEPFESRVRFTNVWVLQEGQWRRAAFHDSPAPEG